MKKLIDSYVAEVMSTDSGLDFDRTQIDEVIDALEKRLGKAHDDNVCEVLTSVLNNLRLTFDIIDDELIVSVLDHESLERIVSFHIDEVVKYSCYGPAALDDDDVDGARFRSKLCELFKRAVDKQSVLLMRE